ncbi:related to peptidyl-prolyl cis-trans isomerase [Sporisorium scitamineum]|uniref:peptidylprolyl isomerase n=1 Tax=Sporisorium scitamineum TaxID=49012 RepID=A0A0F7RV13_9BASI|nr:hypothetical protein [Sporisorium scitamineum]CDU23088.1 related to peptidyl-prolyl cis-trans isomerase [Sporisorium scitamineum]
MTSESEPSKSGNAVSSSTSSPSSNQKMTIDEQLSKAEELKSLGNKAFEQQNLAEALNRWHHSLLYCAGINSFATLYGARSTDAENERAAGITSAVYNNMAACYLRQSKWEKAIYAATKALALAPENLKALYRRAEAYLELGRNQLAARETLMLRSTGDHKTLSFENLESDQVKAFEEEEEKRQLDTATASST